MGAEAVSAVSGMFKVGLVLALVAISVHAAPLYQQQVEDYQEMLMEIEAPPAAGKPVPKAAEAAKAPAGPAGALPFDTVTVHQHHVYDLQKKAIDKHNTYETTKRLVPFKVSAARDKAEKDERKKEEDKVKAAKKANDEAQKETDEQAEKTAKEAHTTAKTTAESETERVHKILHPKKPDVEKADRGFIKRMAKQAEGANVIINADTAGNFFRPGGLGDVPPKTKDVDDKKAAPKKAAPAAPAKAAAAPAKPAKKEAEEIMLFGLSY